MAAAFFPPLVRPGGPIVSSAGSLRRARSAFTVLELMTVIVTISILIAILAPALSYLQIRAQKVKCIGNLRSLHVATSSYIQDNQHWPQISGNGYKDIVAAQAWLVALSPYGLAQINWVCPSIQRALQSPDLSDPANTRVDYLAMPFGMQPRAPFQYPKQPWFIEAADIHGNGQEIIYPDGHIEEAVDIIRAASAGTGH